MLKTVKQHTTFHSDCAYIRIGMLASYNVVLLLLLLVVLMLLLLVVLMLLKAQTMYLVCILGHNAGFDCFTLASWSQHGP